MPLDSSKVSAFPPHPLPKTTPYPQNILLSSATLLEPRAPPQPPILRNPLSSNLFKTSSRRSLAKTNQLNQGLALKTATERGVTEIEGEIIETETERGVIEIEGGIIQTETEAERGVIETEGGIIETETGTEEGVIEIEMETERENIKIEKGRGGGGGACRRHERGGEERGGRWRRRGIVKLIIHG